MSKAKRIAHVASALTILSVSMLHAQQTPLPAPTGATPPARPPRIVRPGVHTPGVSHPMDELKKTAVFPVEGSPDWSVITRDAVWVSSARANHVVQLLPATNTVGLIVDVARPCSGLTEGFGSIWAPSCGTHELDRLDPATGKIVASIPADAANSEGGIATGAGSVWFVVKPSKLLRIDPRSNTVAATIDLPEGTENPTFADGFVWVSSFGQNQLIKVDPETNTVVATIPIGPKPRFIAAGEGSVWTLNQGDGTISRVDTKTGKLVATIECGIPGGGGDLSYADGFVWAAMFDFPLTKVDAKTNKVVGQWAGPGGDGMRAGGGSVWLSNLRLASVWRIPPQQD
jgi:streptogramin lyase